MGDAGHCDIAPRQDAHPKRESPPSAPSLRGRQASNKEQIDPNNANTTNQIEAARWTHAMVLNFYENYRKYI
jgi:hypothetical protein